MIARDERDTKRSAAPLKPAEDAIVIDTSDLDIEAVLARIIPLVEAKL
jgi:cytidylate kinase